jgi:hypothetical protein
MIPPVMLQNLKRGRTVPSAIALPILDPNTCHCKKIEDHLRPTTDRPSYISLTNMPTLLIM